MAPAHELHERGQRHAAHGDGTFRNGMGEVLPGGDRPALSGVRSFQRAGQRGERHGPPYGVERVAEVLSP